jgi:hypothetical protein
VFNYETHPREHTVDLTRLGLDPALEYRVWSHWDSKSIGVHTGRFTAVVPPESVKLYRIARVRDHPWLLSTDLHVRQGQAEIEECRWDPSARQLTIRAVRPPGHGGNVYVAVPRGMALSDPQDLWIAKDARDGSLVVRCSFEFRDSGVVERRLRFK